MTIYSVFYLLMSSALIGFAACWATALLQYPFARWACGANLMRLSSGFWFAWGMLPIVWGSFVVAFGFAFGWLSSIGWLVDHCTQHPGHPHLCLAHISQNPPAGELFWGVTLLSCTLVAAAAVRSYHRYLPTHQLLRGTFSAETRAATQHVSFGVIPSRFPAVFTAGLFLPRPYLTKAAVKLLSAEEQAIVLSHEMEHIRRKDPLRLLFLTFCEYWLPAVRHIRRQWQWMAEIECDRASIRGGFSPDRVALTILKFQRANRKWRSPTMTLAYSANDTCNLKLRIESLFCDRPNAVGQVPVLLGCASLCFLLIFHFSQVHHGLETFLGWLSW